MNRLSLLPRLPRCSPQAQQVTKQLRWYPRGLRNTAGSRNGRLQMRWRMGRVRRCVSANGNVGRRASASQRLRRRTIFVPCDNTASSLLD